MDEAEGFRRQGRRQQKYYEEKFAFIWNIDNSSRASKVAAWRPPHGEGKPFGNKYTAGRGGAGRHLAHDVGAWRYIGQVDNQYVDEKRRQDKAPERARATRKTGGGYADQVVTQPS